MTGYQTRTGNELLSDGTYNYTYDNDGNLLTKTQISNGQATQYTWDYRNRLTRRSSQERPGDGAQHVAVHLRRLQ